MNTATHKLTTIRLTVPTTNALHQRTFWATATTRSYLPREFAKCTSMRNDFLSGVPATLLYAVASHSIRHKVRLFRPHIVSIKA